MRRFASFVLALAAGIFLLPVSALSLSSEEKPTDVQDNHPFYDTVLKADEQDFMEGYPDGSFKPDNSISRAEFITMVVASLTANPQGSDCFKDVKREWYARRVCEARRRGLVSGYVDGTFKPANNINFAEASAILAKAYRLNPLRLKAGEPWYKPAVSRLAEKKSIPVSVEVMWEKLNRGETAEIIYRLKNKVEIRNSKTFASLSAPLPTIASCPELEEKLKSVRYQYGRKLTMRAMPLMMGDDFDAVDEEAADDTGGAPMAATSESKAATDYSSTNVQVAGVDEADIIKNDGEYIYMVSGRAVRIIRAYPPDEMKEVSTWTVPDENFRPSDIYNVGTRLIVLGSTRADAPYNTNTPEARTIYPLHKSRAVVYIVDVSNREKLVQERAIEFDGHTVSSRRVGNHLYLVVNDSPPFQIMYERPAAAQDLIPVMDDTAESGPKPVAPCTSVRFVPGFEEVSFLTVAGINIGDPQEPVQKEVVMGSGSTVYASPESLYVAVTRWEPPVVGIFDTIVSPQGDERTRLMRFTLNKGAVKFVSEGSVEGHLLNQFSMDEEAEAFRLATSVQPAWVSFGQPGKEYNNLIILDRNNLGKELGAIRNIAPGESIHSVRFLGKRAYMVTFKKIDPFFVIDVENPAAPKILGELKIPGFSDYLHPYDENHIIGFGKETVEPREVPIGDPARAWVRDFAWYQGLKVALFDVTDVKNPKVMDKEVTGDRGTESDLLQDHKALYFDKTRGVLAFPVYVAEIDPELKKDGDPSSAYGRGIFQGAYFYKIDLENGLQFLTRVTHHPDDYFSRGKGAYTPERWASWIKRIVSIGEFYYTVSLDTVKALNRDPIAEVRSIEVPFDKNDYGEPIMLE